MKDLLKNVIEARNKVEDLKGQLKVADQQKDEAERFLIEAMEAQNLKSLDVKGVGRATLGKPRVYASCGREDQERLFIFLDEQCGRGDLIQKTVFPASLSGFASERLEQGESLPEFIKTYLKQSLIIKKS